MTTPRYFRSIETKQAGADRRVARLEKRQQLPSAIEGEVGDVIQFEVDNEGGWLYVETSGTRPDDWAGIALETGEGSGGSSNGIRLRTGTSSAGIGIYDNGSGIEIEAVNSVEVSCEGFQVNAGEGDIHLFNDPGDITLQAGDDVILQPDSGYVRLENLPTSDPMTGNGAIWVDTGAGNVLKQST